MPKARRETGAVSTLCLALLLAAGTSGAPAQPPSALDRDGETIVALLRVNPQAPADVQAQVAGCAALAGAPALVMMARQVMLQMPAAMATAVPPPASDVEPRGPSVRIGVMPPGTAPAMPLWIAAGTRTYASSDAAAQALAAGGWERTGDVLWMRATGCTAGVP